MTESGLVIGVFSLIRFMPLPKRKSQMAVDCVDFCLSTVSRSIVLQDTRISSCLPATGWRVFSTIPLPHREDEHDWTWRTGGPAAKRPSPVRFRSEKPRQYERIFGQRDEPLPVKTASQAPEAKTPSPRRPPRSGTRETPQRPKILLSRVRFLSAKGDEHTNHWVRYNNENSGPLSL